MRLGAPGRYYANKTRYAFAIMAKASESGRVKTRLVPPLTPAEAADLNTCFLADVSGNVLEAARHRAIDGFFAYATAGEEAFFAAHLPPRMALLPPREPGLGRSLLHAMNDLLTAGYAGACLVNSDSPTLPTSILIDVVDRLREPTEQVVLGPCDDGGYYLIAMRTFHPRLFEDIAWSTEVVLSQTLERAAEIGLKASLLPQWYDVDDAAMLRRLRVDIDGMADSGDGLFPFPAPNTRAFLRALDTPQLVRKSA
jgi:rSAM/selenodomain-associated transferase 1